MCREKEHVSTFEAESDSGEVYTVYVYRTILSLPSAAGLHKIPGLPDYQTSDGQDVNRIEKGVYEIVGFPNIIIRTSDPDAP